MSTTLLKSEIRFEQDVVTSRQRTRQIAELLGFDALDQTRIATAVSEICRNAFQYAKGGSVEFCLEDDTPQTFQIRVSDRGQGIADLKSVLDGQYRSETGMGIGMVGSNRLMDQFEVDSVRGQGTTVVMGKLLPKRASAVTPERLREIVNELVQRPPQNPLEEIQQQNQELLRTLAQLRQREEELTQLNRELEDTNRGVVSLYAELDERADSLQNANELKTRFLSNMSHEFRTPLNSIVSLTRMLIDRLDGDLTSEQEKQVTFILKAAEGLSELVNDLLDLAKVEAGKIVIHPSAFEVSDLFGSLRGMLRPLLAHNSAIALVFEEPEGIPTLQTDEGKVAQILRNFISNALKYTERGEVRVTAKLTGGTVVFSVADTGIGIAPADQARVFEEFVQIDSSLQRRSKGTGLGLPLSQKLAELLGGRVSLSSEVGVGSTFSASIPLTYPGFRAESFELSSQQLDPMRLPVLVVEDNPDVIFAYEKYFDRSCYQIISAQTLEQAKQALQTFQPIAIILDILLAEQHTWDFLAETKENKGTQAISILVATAVNNREKALALGADAFLCQPVDRWQLINTLNTLVRSNILQTVLLIDDDPLSRYLLKEHLDHTQFKVLEAADGRVGIQIAHTEQPACVILDLSMPEIGGVEVLDRLKTDPATRQIPVIIRTSQILEEAEYQSLEKRAIAVLSKEQSDPTTEFVKLKEALLKAGLAFESWERTDG